MSGSKDTDQKKGDEILRRMLKTPPKPHKAKSDDRPKPKRSEGGDGTEPKPD